MAKLVRINADKTRYTMHETPGVGTSQRRKHLFSAATQEYYAVRLLKRAPHEDQTEYFVELTREEAEAVYLDLDAYLGKDAERLKLQREAYFRRGGFKP